MKKTILAVVVTGLFTATVQAATVYDSEGTTADIYGRVQFDIKDPGKADVTGKGSARFGVKASSEVAPGLKAIAHGEWQFDAENSAGDNEVAARHVYLGVEHDKFGKLVFGQTDTAFYQAVAATDIFNSYGYAAFSGVEDGRQEGQLVYKGQFDSVYVGASYQFSDTEFSASMGNPSNTIPSETGVALDSGYALTVGYNFGFGLDVYAGYHAENLANDEGLAAADGTKTNIALSAGYTLDKLYLGAAVVKASYDGDEIHGGKVVLLDGAELFGFDLVASYQVADKVAVYGGYAKQDAEGAIEALGEQANELTIGTVYKLNSHAKVWGEYKVDNTDGADNQWTLAAQYNF